MSKNMKALKDPFVINNPISVQVLGICSALAVTTQVMPALIMSIAVTAVLAFSNLSISLMRKMIPNKIRIIVELTVIATLVILVDQILKAYAFDISKQLSVFVGLIITNCIVMGRAEAFAMHNPPIPSVMDGIGNGIGYGAILVIVAAIREFFAGGKLCGMELIKIEPGTASPFANGVMVVPAGAFFVIAILIWIQRDVTKDYEEN